jgi:hypothetical protein
MKLGRNLKSKAVITKQSDSEQIMKFSIDQSFGRVPTLFWLSFNICTYFNSANNIRVDETPINKTNT